MGLLEKAAKRSAELAGQNDIQLAASQKKKFMIHHTAN